MIVWNGMDIIGLIILGIIFICMVLRIVCVIIGSKISEHRKKRNERLANKGSNATE